MTLVDEALQNELGSHSTWNEEHRRLADPSLDALREAGLLRLLVPARVGGDQLGLTEMVEAVRSTAWADGAASWVLMVLTAHDWMMGSMSEQAQDEVYADGPDTVIPGSLAPAGTTVKTDGGWRVSGRWPFASGAVHGHWYLVGSIEAVGEEGTRPRLVHVVLPRDEIELDDTWHPIGLRGTGSGDVVADNVLVPDHRAIDSGALLGGRSPWSARHDTDLYKAPILPGLATHVAASALGIAEAGLADAADRFGVQDDRYSGSAKVDRPGLHMRMAESTAELRTAELLIDDTVELLQFAAAGADSKVLRAQAKYQATYAIELCRRATERVANAAGGRALFDSSRLQRCFRDVTMASQHAVADLDTVGQAYGRTLLGLDPGRHPL